jgi:hypothetical protein
VRTGTPVHRSVSTFTMICSNVIANRASTSATMDTPASVSTKKLEPFIILKILSDADNYDSFIEQYHS